MVANFCHWETGNTPKIFPQYPDIIFKGPENGFPVMLNTFLRKAPPCCSLAGFFFIRLILPLLIDPCCVHPDNYELFVTTADLSLLFIRLPDTPRSLDMSATVILDRFMLNRSALNFFFWEPSCSSLYGVPDYIIGIGQIDDAVILGLSLYFLEKDLRKYKEWKDRNG